MRSSGGERADYREKSSESSLYKQLDFATDFASYAARIGNLVFCIFEKTYNYNIL